MKRLSTLVLLFLLVLSIGGCQREIPPELTEPIEQDENPLGVEFDDQVPTEYNQLYMTEKHGGYYVYKDCFYYLSNFGFLQYIRLNEPNKNLRTRTPDAVPTENSACGDPLCDGNYETCLAYLGHMNSKFLIDEVESAGENPVIYFYMGSDIYRLDSGAGTREKVVTSAEPINKLAAFEDRLYFTTQTSEDSMAIHTVLKSGGEVVTQTPGDSYLNLIGGNQNGIYVNDEKGNIYALDHAFESADLIYTVSEVYPMKYGDPVSLNMFVEGEYLYFFADFTVEELTWGDATDEFIRHSIRRVRVDHPVGEGEVVAESVYEQAVYGVHDGVLYYAPFNVKVGLKEMDSTVYHSYFSHSDGTITGVNLSTLETQNVTTDCGINFQNVCYYVDDQCFIGIAHPYKNGMGLDLSTSGTMVVLFVYESGAVYRLCGNVG